MRKLESDERMFLNQRISIQHRNNLSELRSYRILSLTFEYQR